MSNFDRPLTKEEEEAIALARKAQEKLWAEILEDIMYQFELCLKLGRLWD